MVTTWRRRHADFPAAVAHSAGRTLFHGGQVAEWLTSTGLGNADPAELRSEMALFSVMALTDRFSAWQLVEVLGSLLCLRKLDERPLLAAAADERPVWASVMHRAERLDAEDEFVLRELRSVDVATAAPLARFAEDLVEAAYDEHGAYEWLLASRFRLGLDALTADAVTEQVLNLLVQLTDLRARLEHGESVTLADPHARAGDLLAALLHKSGDRENTTQNVTVLAADPDEQLARIACRRLLLAGVDELALDVQAGVDLEERLADPDLIVTQLPYRPGEERSVLAALKDVERIADLLGSGATALVLGPADALVDALRGTEESRLRSALLRSNVVEAVIALPGGVLPYRPGYRSALWVLTRDPVPAANGKVLLADISAETMTADVCARLAEDVLLWRAEGFRALGGHDPCYGRAVDVANLDRAFGGPLAPPAPPTSAILARAVIERPTLIADAEAQLERAVAQARSYEDAHGSYRGGVLRRTGRIPQRTTLGALLAEGRVIKLKGYRLDKEHIVTGDGHHSVLGPEEVTGDNPIGARRMDRMVLAAAYERVTLTEPGDVIYTLTPRLGLHVDHEGFSVVAFPARVLRVVHDANRPLSPRVLAALLGAARDTGRSPSAVRPARRIEDYQVPDLDPDDVERFDGLLAEIERREKLLRAQDDALAEARRLTIAGLADGTLALESTPTNRREWNSS
ncbi:N-6 DNA methylase [Actinomadura spongiicola]|uniref:N-6 DNA methylase n=1 Tax=Actinomadura spongiicola TaxID=2303421 RepID=UPI001F2E8861|nr:N-6 DNA methylase [Actinomadura spongiicola]